MVDQMVTAAWYDDDTSSGTSVFPGSIAKRSEGDIYYYGKPHVDTYYRSPLVCHCQFVDFIPNLTDTSYGPDSAEYRAMQWLSQDNGISSPQNDTGAFFTEDIESLVQRYDMAT
jgi:hypothetical protein